MDGGVPESGPSGVEPLGRDDPEESRTVSDLRHGFANTLQILTALIRLRLGRTTNPEVHQNLGWLQDVIVALGLLYTRGGGTERATVAEFLAAFADSWRPLCAERRIRVEIEADPTIVVPDRVAMPIALAAHELVTNAWRHAFADGRAGRIAIRLTRDGDDAVLEVGDDGLGLPAQKADGLGMELLPRLAEQTGGELLIHSDGGTVARLRFPLA